MTDFETIAYNSLRFKGVDESAREAPIQRIACVLGMHRSGTSALTRCLNFAGLSLGPEANRLITGEDNERGFWECMPLRLLNDDILAAFHGNWLCPPLLRKAWWKDVRLGSLTDRARHQLSESLQGDQVVWKDPRNCLTLPFWSELFSSRPVVAWIRRNPLEVAKSLEKRNQLTRVKALALSSIYYQSALLNLESRPVVIVDFHELLEKPGECLGRVCDFLFSCGFDGLEVPSQSQLEEFLSWNLLHWERDESDLRSDPDILPEQLELFEAVQRLPPASKSFKSPTQLSEEFLLGCHLRLLEDRRCTTPSELEERVAAYDPINQELQRILRKSSFEHDQLESLQALHKDSSERNTYLSKRLKTLQAQNSRLRSDRVHLRSARDQLKGKLQNLSAELGRLKTELASQSSKEQVSNSYLERQAFEIERIALETVTSELRTRLEEFQRWQGKLHQERDRLQRELWDAESEAGRLRQARDEATRRAGGLEEGRLQLQDQLDSVSAELNDQSAAVTELEVELTSVRRDLLEQSELARRLEARCQSTELEKEEGLHRERRMEVAAHEQTSVIRELRYRLQALENERDEAVAEARRLREESKGILGSVERAAWSGMHSAYLALPFGKRVRERLKDGFYAVHGRLFPESAHYQIYLQARRDRQEFPHPGNSGSSTQQRSMTRTGRRSVDILIFPVIDWHFRHQRPQQMALALAGEGYRVFYFSTRFASGTVDYTPEIEFVPPGVHLIHLPCGDPEPVIYHDLLNAEQLEQVLDGLEVVREHQNIGATVTLVNHPFWLPVVSRLTNNRLVYDCMDYHAGFSNTAPAMLDMESDLLAKSDLVICSSQRLDEKLTPLAPNRILIRNAAEFEHFSKRPPELLLPDDGPIIGYFGAIADWFDSDLVACAAAELPECRFVLIGSTVFGNIEPLKTCENVILVGEVPYRVLPGYLHAFDVCIIPFKINELTLCTNPVKVYEYLSAGKPVVSVRLPELESLEGIVRIGDGPQDFVDKLREALRTATGSEAARRRDFARQHTWRVRASELKPRLESLFPRVSVVVLTHNNLEFTRACLDSLEQLTDYPNWELIVVDNASEDGTPRYLQDYAEGHPARIILNQRNLGFAAGNNRGAREATGDYLVFLNNDTFVTRGWMADMVRHFKADPALGALNPVTNNIGNEAKIEIHYRTMEEMATAARRYTSTHWGELLDLRTTAFFCVMIPAKTWKEVGELDETFGIGFFEDDDYSQRLIEKGYRLACAEDVFVHHHLSATFDSLSTDQRQELFERNKRLYEEKWSEWEPHQYRTPQG